MLPLASKYEKLCVSQFVRVYNLTTNRTKYLLRFGVVVASYKVRVRTVYLERVLIHAIKVVLQCKY